MTDQQQATTALIEAIEAEKFRMQDAFTVWPDRHEHKDEDPAHYAAEAYHGSLDAAMSLHKALVPDWRWWVADALYWAIMEGEAPRVTLARGTAGIDLRVVHAHSETCPARAWLLAILRAYASQLPAASNRKGAAE